MKKIGIYHYQYYRGACKLCYRHFIQEMVESYEGCHEVAKNIYGNDLEFLHYTDFGPYESEDINRPSFHRIEAAIENNEFDAVMCYTLNNITTNETSLIKFYKKVRAKGMDFLTCEKGLEAMRIIDFYIEKNNL